MKPIILLCTFLFSCSAFAVDIDGGVCVRQIPVSCPPATTGACVRQVPISCPLTTTAPAMPAPRSAIVGLNVQQHAGTFDAQGQAFTKALRPQSIRLAYRHGDHDFGVNWASQNGIGVLFFLGYGKGCDPTTSAGRQCYANRSAGLAAKYGSKVQYYEVWNEWNAGFGLGCYWRQPGTPCVDAAMYTDLLCRTHKAIKVVRPTAKVVGGATAGIDIRFITKMLDAGAANCMDAISVHPYVWTQTLYSVPYASEASVGVNKAIEAVTAVHNLVKSKSGKTMTVLMTEDGRNDKGLAANELRTAEYLTGLFSRAPPFLGGVWWFELEDEAAVQPGWGLVRSSNSKKPAYDAFIKAAAAKRVIEGQRSITPIGTRRCKGLKGAQAIRCRKLITEDLREKGG